MTMEELTHDYPPEANPPPEGYDFWAIFIGIVAMVALAVVTLYFSLLLFYYNLDK